MKLNPFLVAILGAVLLTIQQLQFEKVTDLKVIGLAVLITILGATGTQLKGKGPTLFGIIGTVCATFVNVWQTSTFTWNEFLYTGVIAVLALIVPSAKPEIEQKKE